MTLCAVFWYSHTLLFTLRRLEKDKAVFRFFSIFWTNFGNFGRKASIWFLPQEKIYLIWMFCRKRNELRQPENNFSEISYMMDSVMSSHLVVYYFPWLYSTFNFLPAAHSGGRSASHFFTKTQLLLLISV